MRALSEFGFGALGIQVADLCSPGMVVQLGVAPNRIDLLTAISGVSFEEAWATAGQPNWMGSLPSLLAVPRCSGTRSGPVAPRTLETRRNCANGPPNKTVERAG